MLCFCTCIFISLNLINYSIYFKIRIIFTYFSFKFIFKNFIATTNI